MVGVDIVNNFRIKKIIEKHGDFFIKKIFTDVEIEYCQNRRYSYTHFSARFAAKEAFLKSIRTGLSSGIKWKDMEVVNDASGAPVLNITGKALEILGKRKCNISLSHEKEFSVAFVVLSA